MCVIHEVNLALKAMNRDDEVLDTTRVGYSVEFSRSPCVFESVSSAVIESVSRGQLKTLDLFIIRFQLLTRMFIFCYVYIFDKMPARKRYKATPKHKSTFPFLTADLSNSLLGYESLIEVSSLLKAEADQESMSILMLQML